ncbi:hypothetical protein CEXT_559031 [Caerostris extrusa]|uniref:Uncharacterized protein n=1 Tax=Caerostris extrusa TaxID=172846 RepID=A0AAV4RA03_CAEEX|nr:hypothetical protein CEXT_559031 [Caerostris extrusa]
MLSVWNKQINSRLILGKKKKNNNKKNVGKKRLLLYDVIIRTKLDGKFNSLRFSGLSPPYVYFDPPRSFKHTFLKMDSPSSTEGDSTRAVYLFNKEKNDEVKV